MGATTRRRLQKRNRGLGHRKGPSAHAGTLRLWAYVLVDPTRRGAPSEDRGVVWHREAPLIKLS